ncbi:IclR family transcriptional regulator, partial [Reinekea sp.]
ILETTEFISQNDGLYEADKVAKILGYPPASAQKLFADMKLAGFLQESILGRLTLAKEFRDLSEATLKHQNFKNERMRELNALSETIGETCGISLPSGVNMIYFERSQSNWPIQIHLPQGAHVPMTASASGKLYLSSLPVSAQKLFLYNIGIERFTRNTEMDSKKLMAELVTIKSQGFAVDNEEFIEGMCSIAVPIKNNTAAFGYLFCHAPAFRTSHEELLSFLPDIKLTADKIMSVMLPDLSS